MLLLLQSIIVYGLMVWVMTHFGKIAYKSQYPQGIGGVDMYLNKKIPFSSLVTKSYYLIPIFVFCFFAAVRYRVGVDSISYKAYFYEILNYGKLLNENSAEDGFILIGKICASITDSHYLMFFVLAFLQISFLYYAVRKQNYAAVYLGMAIMLSGTFFTLMNGVRQSIAACVLVAIIPLALKKKNWGWFIIATFITMTMHKSAIMFIPIGLISYFILNKGILNVYIQLSIVAACFLLMDKIELPILDVLFSYGEHAGYDENSIEAYSELEQTNKSFGIWGFLILVAQLIMVKYSNKTQAIVKDDLYNVMYNLFFIGLCFSLLFYNNFTIGRLNYYFIIFQPVILSTTLFFLTKSHRTIDRNMFYLVILVLSTNILLLLYKSLAMLGKESSLYKFDFFN